MSVYRNSGPLATAPADLSAATQLTFDGPDYRRPVALTRGDQLATEARAYLEQNPRFWEEFCDRAFELHRRGRRRYGAKALVEVIRWHSDVGRGREYKINNNHVPAFARIFDATYPELGGFFRTRELISNRKRVRRG